VQRVTRKPNVERPIDYAPLSSAAFTPVDGEGVHACIQRNRLSHVARETDDVDTGMLTAGVERENRNERSNGIERLVVVSASAAMLRAAATRHRESTLRRRACRCHQRASARYITMQRCPALFYYVCPFFTLYNYAACLRSLCAVTYAPPRVHFLTINAMALSGSRQWFQPYRFLPCNLVWCVVQRSTVAHRCQCHLLLLPISSHSTERGF